MRRHTYYVLGYGIHIDVLPEITIEKLAELIHSAPQFERRLYLELLEENLSGYIKRGANNKLDIATVLQAVIKECEELDLVIAVSDEENGEETFLLYPPTYPWEVTESNKISLAKVTAILTGEKAEPQYFDWGSTS